VGVVMAEAIGVLIQEMTTRECWRMLARSNIFRLACARDNQPYIVPLRVDLDGEFLYGYATLGRKIEWMRTNPLVCLECDELTTERHWATVIIFGHYEELPHTPENESARQVAERLFQKHPMWWQPATVPLGGHERRPPIVFRIHVDSFTGRRTIQEARTPERQEARPESERPGWLTRMWRRVGPSR
jgi:uncharacterized protein